jgi:uncharacterized MAPEG superfamily protein
MTAHEVRSSPVQILWRVFALVLSVLAIVATAPAARAVEDATPAPGAEQERLTYEELQSSSSQRAQEFFPEAYEEPSFFQWISIPVLITGLIIALLLLGAYLWWQPRFAAERREKQRR